MDDAELQAYAELAVNVALNLQPGQRLMIVGPPRNGGASLEAAALARAVAAVAYRGGSPLVETIYGDEMQQLIRFKHARPDTFSTYSAWFPRAVTEHIAAGHAILGINANDPDLLQSQPSELVSALLRATSSAIRPFHEQLARNETNWTILAGVNDRWALKIFGNAPVDEARRRLWNAIARLCRLDAADPIAAWKSHLRQLALRTEYLNRKRYSGLKYTGPGTNLTLGLPDGHLWVTSRSVSPRGIPFIGNFPTEEVFTLAHKDRVDGTVRTTKPLCCGDRLIEECRVVFEHGRVVQVSAERNVDTLQWLLDTDDGARRLGEVALVPHSSPISQSGLLFYNTIFDENAASHLALGDAYRSTLEHGDDMSDEEFERAGGNRSAVHVDFMIGSGELDIDGLLADGSVEPVMRGGEWAFKHEPMTKRRSTIGRASS